LVARLGQTGVAVSTCFASLDFHGREIT